MRIVVTGAAGFSSDITCRSKLVFTETGRRQS
ncbi:MAG: hypothetical protein JWQ13_3520 [Ramlibacter sp.]|nr:hypothetical protein [Ramlibacter sp.]